MKKLILLLLPLACILAGCKYDDSKIWEELNAQRAQIAALESLNSNVSSLQSIVSALQKNITVTAVKTTDKGHMVSFSDGSTVEILNAESVTPKLGVKQDSDGDYYWTLNGKWILDDAGKQVPVGKTPLLKVEDDQWAVSYDNGTTWSKVEGQAASICLFESITTDAVNATFTLADGSVITVPLTNKANKLQLIFDETVFAKMRNGEVLNTTYKIVAPEGVQVNLETFESDGWTVTVYPADERSGRISIKAPATAAPTKVMFILTDENNGSFTKVIKIGVNEEAKPTVQTEYTIDPEGGELIIPISSCVADLSESAEGWAEVTSTGDQIVLNITSNESYDYRHATLTLEDGTVISLTQITRDALIVSTDKVTIDGRRQKVNFVVKTNIRVTATVTEGSGWLTVSPKTKALADKVFTFTASRNTTGEERTASITFSGNGLSGTCTVIQAVYDGPDAVDITEAVATEEGEEVNLKPSFVNALTTDGYVVTDGSSAIFVSDASNKPALGDSVSFGALTSTFNGIPSLSDVDVFTTTSTGNRVVYPKATDITGTLDTFEASSPEYVSVTGDLTITGGVYNLAVSGANTKVVIYKPSYVVGLEALAGNNVTVDGYYYGTADGTMYIIATKKTDNGPSSGGGGGGGSTTVGYSYKKVTTVTSGKPYLIVVNDGSSSLVSKPVSSNYGWLYTDTATDNNGEIVLKSKDNEFVITSSASGYTIAQSDGRYLYQKGTYNNFNVDAAPTEGQYWTIEAENGGTFKITNISVSKYIQYSVEHKSFGSYESAQDGAIMPCLYEYSGETTIEDGGEGGGGSGVAGETETIDFTAKGFENGVQYKTVEGSGATVNFGDGSNDGKYYTTGTAIRVYGNGYVKISSTSTIVKIVYTFQKATASNNPTYPTDDKFSLSTGSLSISEATATWTGSATSVSLTRPSGSGHWRLQKVEITYGE